MLEPLKPSHLSAVTALAMFLLTAAAQQQPSAKAQQRPPRPESAYQVVSVELRPLKTGPRPVTCPAKPTFYGTIDTNGPVVVKYTWLTSDGKSWPTQVLRFSAKGQKSVTKVWRVGARGKTVNAWIQLKVISPNEMVSTKTSVTLNCAK